MALRSSLRFASSVLVSLAVSLGLAACGTESPVDPPAPDGTRAAFDLSADVSEAASFWQLPIPSDLRLDAAGAPDFDGYPNTVVAAIDGFKNEVKDRRGWPMLPVAHFDFDGPMVERSHRDALAVDVSAGAFLLDLGDDSPAKGSLVPIVAETPLPDDAVPADFLSLAPRPGFVLRGDTKYAFVVLRSFGDAAGEPLGVPEDLAALAAGNTPEGERGAAATELYAPLWPALEALGVSPADVAAATVFTTGDVVADDAAMIDKLVEAYDVTIGSIELDTTNLYDTVCKLKAKVVYPQFQAGAPPFDTEGLFTIGPDGLPVKVRDEEAPVVLSIPKTLMPSSGYPFALNVHGSGGKAVAVVNGGGDLYARGTGVVFGTYGIAAAGSAMPVNPERLPGAGDIAYVNFNNIPATRDIFRQGVIEQRLFLEALSKLEIPADVLAGCAGPELDAGATAFRFDLDRLIVTGQSMGGWYTNMISAQEPKVKAIIPTGAGGFFPFFLTEAGDEQVSINQLTGAVPVAILGTTNPVSFMHPGAALAEAALEAADPIAYLPRIAQRPLPGHAPRSIYEPVGKADSYFNEAVFDAFSVGYGNEQAGEVVWQSMQDALALDGRDGLVPYAVSQNRLSESGEPYTGVVVQWVADGDYDPHAIYSRHDQVRFQYGCFAKSFVETGVGTVPAPQVFGAPCP